VASIPHPQHRQTLCLQDPVLTADFAALLTDEQVVAQLRHLAAGQRAGGGACGELSESLVTVPIVVGMCHPDLILSGLSDESAFPQPLEASIVVMANISQGLVPLLGNLTELHSLKI
jgi:hypothetical protein